MKDWYRDLILGALELATIALLGALHVLPSEAIAGLLGASIAIRARSAPPSIGVASSAANAGVLGVGLALGTKLLQRLPALAVLGALILGPGGCTPVVRQEAGAVVVGVISTVCGAVQGVTYEGVGVGAICAGVDGAIGLVQGILNGLPADALHLEAVDAPAFATLYQGGAEHSETTAIGSLRVELVDLVQGELDARAGESAAR